MNTFKSPTLIHHHHQFPGFSSVIPGFPRYSVIGDRRHGVYNLRVSNASLEDDAEYQCQVGPARLHKAIRANARLSVICKYTTLCKTCSGDKYRIFTRKRKAFYRKAFAEVYFLFFPY